jgi:putative membrane protein
MTTEPLNAATRLAITRTCLAHERTLMAWVRTSASLISFGFTIYKFFQYLHDNQPPPDSGVVGPRGFAIALIVIGIMSLVLGTVEHRHNMTGLREEFGVVVPRSLATAIGSLVSVLGLLGLVIVLLRQ